MKFQNPSFKFFLNGQTNKRTDKPKAICSPLFQSWGHKKDKDSCSKRVHLRKVSGNSRYNGFLIPSKLFTTKHRIAFFDYMHNILLMFRMVRSLASKEYTKEKE